MPLNNRVTNFRQKTDTGFNVADYFGTLPKFIDTTKNSPLSNLEEELLLGNNFVSYSWDDETQLYGLVHRNQKEFRTKSQTGGYYYILDTVADNVIADDDMVYNNGGILFIPGDNGDDTGTSDDNVLEDSTLKLITQDDGTYVYSLISTGTSSATKKYGAVVFNTARNDFVQFIEQLVLWYKPEDATSDDDDYLIAIMTITPSIADSTTNKVVQSKQVESCWSDNENRYLKKAEVGTEWQIV